MRHLDRSQNGGAPRDTDALSLRFTPAKQRRILIGYLYSPFRRSLSGPCQTALGESWKSPSHNRHIYRLCLRDFRHCSTRDEGRRQIVIRARADHTSSFPASVAACGGNPSSGADKQPPRRNDRNGLRASWRFRRSPAAETLANQGNQPAPSLGGSWHNVLLTTFPPPLNFCQKQLIFLNCILIEIWRAATASFLNCGHRR